MGMLVTPITTLKAMLTQCVAFQSWLGVEGEADPIAAAAAKVFIEGVPRTAGQDAFTKEDYEALRPFAIVYGHEGESHSAIRVGDPSCFDVTGSAIVTLETPVDPDATPEAFWIDLAGQIELIINNETSGQPGLLQLGSSPGGLKIRSIKPDFFGRTPENEVNSYGDCYIVLLLIEWG